MRGYERESIMSDLQPTRNADKTDRSLTKQANQIADVSDEALRMARDVCGLVGEPACSAPKPEVPVQQVALPGALDIIEQNVRQIQDALSYLLRVI